MKDYIQDTSTPDNPHSQLSQRGSSGIPQKQIASKQARRKRQGFKTPGRAPAQSNHCTTATPSNLQKSIPTEAALRMDFKKKVPGQIKRSYQNQELQKESQQRLRTQMSAQYTDMLLSDQNQEAQVVASAKPQLYHQENSKRNLCHSNQGYLIHEQIQEKPDERKPKRVSVEKGDVFTEKEVDPKHSRLEKQIFKQRTEQNENKLSKIKKRKNRTNRRGAHVNANRNLIDKNKMGHEQNEMLSQEEVYRMLQHQNKEALKDNIKVIILTFLNFYQINTTQMSETLQRWLSQPANGQGSRHISDEQQYIFAKYCPQAPHNTTQFLTNQYETSILNSLLNPGGIGMNTVGCFGSLIWDELQVAEREINQNIENERFDDLEEIQENESDSSNEAFMNGGNDNRKEKDADLLSSCKLNNKCEHQIGSSNNSYEALQTLSTLSMSSRSLNNNALDQIGASMEGTFFNITQSSCIGFMTASMFDDLSLSETDFITQISGSSNNEDEYGNFNEMVKASEVPLYTHEATIPLNQTTLNKHQSSQLPFLQGTPSFGQPLNEAESRMQWLLQHTGTTNTNVNEPSARSQNTAGKEMIYQNSLQKQSDEFSEVLKLQVELDSSKYLIQQLERELMLKSALIDIGGFQQWQYQQESPTLNEADYIENIQPASMT